MIKILICDDQDMVREGLQVILDLAPTLEVVGMADNGQTAIELLPSCQPDVVLMDLRMPILNGIQATRHIRDHFPTVRVLVLTTYDADDWILDAIQAGASGYLLKDTPREALIRAIEGTAAGQSHIDPNIAGKLLAHVSQSQPRTNQEAVANLSDREIEILQLLGRGFLNSDIAQRLGLSEGTIRNYVSTILSKLHLADRTQAAVFALRNGLIGYDE